MQEGEVDLFVIP